MNIACLTYRSWAKEIYENLKKKYIDYNFLIITSKQDFNKEVLIGFQPDLILWYGWSWMVEAEFINNYECIMLHPSPLPKFRGGSPIQNQIIRGKNKTMVTLFRMTNELDKGDIYVQTPMSLEGNIEEIFKRMSTIGFEASCKIIDKEFILIKQNEASATYYKRRKPSDSEITIEEIQNQSGEYLFNKIRMLTGPYPRAFIKTSDGKKLLIHNVELI